MKNTLLLAAACTILAVGCSQPEKQKQGEETPVDTILPSDNVTPSGEELNTQSMTTISPDSLAYFEDLSIDDEKKRKETVVKINGILKLYRQNLPNQASYSSMKFYETFTQEFLQNYAKVDEETKAVWVYYIAAELILRAPSNEMKNAEETLKRVEDGCGCQAEMKTLKEFDKRVLEQAKTLLQ